MRKISRHFVLIFMTVLAVAGCQKNYVLTDVAGSETTGNNCKLSSLVEADPQTGKGDYAYLSTFDASQKVTRIMAVDSTTNTVDDTYNISYPSGKVQLTATEYFVVGADGKVTEFHGYESLDGSPSTKTINRYTYNATGQMTKRTLEYDSVPGLIIMESDYTYTGSNLTKEEVKINTGVTLLKVADIAYEYDLTKRVKSFLVMHAAAPELFIFQTAINAGTASVNAPVKITSQVLDSTGVPQTTITNLANYVLDANNYVKSFQVTGDDFVYGGLTSGYKYVLAYHCQ